MDLLSIVLQLVFGWLVKRWPALKALPSKLIPVFNAIIAALIQLAALGIGTANASGDSLITLLPTERGHSGWWAVWEFLKPVILNTLLSTGIFSGVKNTRQYIGQTKAQRRADVRAKEE